MTPDNIKIKFPLWDYLNQPLFSSDTKFILNPQKFEQVWRIQLLEKCLAKQCDATGHHQS
ncbi:MAG: hypothetical protein F6K61_12100 [Sphaerospermopsis sp. SIO1G1]|nr:hypothetical protein [Sphaerospermopsis sp. SIO1G1]